MQIEGCVPEFILAGCPELSAPGRAFLFFIPQMHTKHWLCAGRVAGAGSPEGADRPGLARPARRWTQNCAVPLAGAGVCQVRG